MTFGFCALVPPSRPVNLQFGNVSSTSIEVQWKSSFDGFSPIVSFKLEIRTNSGLWQNVSDSIIFEKFTVKHLRPYTWYYARVFAKNGVGWSEASESNTVRTEEDCKCHCSYKVMYDNTALPPTPDLAL